MAARTIAPDCDAGEAETDWAETTGPPTARVAVSVPARVSLVKATGFCVRHWARCGVVSAQAGSSTSLSRSA